MVLHGDAGMSHLTKLDDNLLPRAEAIQDFSAANSQQLNFKVMTHAQHYNIIVHIHCIICHVCMSVCPYSLTTLFSIHHFCLPTTPHDQRGDVLNLLEKIGSDWYSGENTRTGAFGDFPASSIRVILPLP